MNFNSISILIHKIPDEFPEYEGAFLVRRNRFGVTWWEVLIWDGRHWVTGMKDDPDSMIEAWVDLKNFDKIVEGFKNIIPWETALKEYKNGNRDLEYWSDYFGRWDSEITEWHDVNEEVFSQYTWRRRTH